MIGDKIPLLMPRTPDISSVARNVEPVVTVAAIILAPLVNLHPPGMYFTLSDFLFCISLVLLAAGGRIALVPYGHLTLLWMAGLFALTISFLFCSAIWGDSVRGFIIVGQYVFSYWLLGFVLVARELSVLELFVKSWIFSILVINAIGVTAFTLGFDITDRFTGFGGAWRLVSGSGRLQTTLADPSASANAIALTLPLLFYLWHNHRVKGIVLIGSFLLLLTSVIMTSSVNGLLCVGLSLSIILLIRINWRVVMGIIASVVVIMLFAGTWGAHFLPSTFQKRVLSAIESGDIELAGTYVDRMIVLREAMEQINQQPFRGVGVDQFRKYTTSKTTVHNVYLLVWVEGGLLALIGWLLILATPFIAWIHCVQIARASVTGTTILAVGLVFASIAISNPHMYARFWMVPLQLAIGLALSAFMRFTEAEFESRRR